MFIEIIELSAVAAADNYPKLVISAPAGIRQSPGCRSKILSLAGIKSGMTTLAIQSPGL